MSNIWEKCAEVVGNNYGMMVDWEERFFICPHCDEVVLDEDWDEEEYEGGYCPICGGLINE